ncbi:MULTISPECIES: zinc ribbon domain-containing protein [Citrobacter]|uniref:Zinc ribbon domain n=2 Tax=Citrobacter freundii complex TaxID=1344959 RepID=A0A5P2ME50_9ENTR|nr:MULTISPECIES: zinc ribbon domain-containing protein [Citrobacter]AHY12115.1 hypothetical protein CFNIH1_11520 [Citrobacter freundii CFNIH1]MBS6075874.1 hypothetical protein [Citrobacter freundii]AYL64836.1 hypothetical protein CUC50_01540 [Citrobacter werkmanii]KAA0558276.1 hypothetical protein F0329_07970 [Citrobacter werkmanii]MBC2618042.1 hypothetical protein [Citrobacter cronae]
MTEHERFCQACGMPISGSDANVASNQYCTWCSDADGNLKSWDEAVAGLAAFLDSWQKVGPEEARIRAKRYLTAMPAWAHKADNH